jgi:hypothetical protein
MDVSALLIELFGRVDEHVEGVVDGLDPAWLAATPAQGVNPVGWLLWHLSRVQDSHVADAFDEEQVWVGDGWAARFGLDPDPGNTGYGHTPAEVAAVRPDGIDAVTGYHRAVAERTRSLLATLSPADLDRVVDERWDPPVTLGVRLVSIADDDIQHAGQAAYLKGLLRADPPR